jgi:hypothetical protein
MSESTHTEKAATAPIETPKGRPKPKSKPIAVPAAKARITIIRNLMHQKLAVNVVLADGSQVGYELEARGTREIPYTADPGPDVESKRVKKYLSVFEKPKP